MAGRGPAPEADRSKVRSRKRQPDPIPLPEAPAVAGPDLGVPPPVIEAWHPETLAYYERWRSSPQASAFMVTDWQTLRRAAVLFDLMWTTGSLKHATELRQCETLLGATVMDRLRLRMAAPKGPAPMPVAAPPPDELAAKRRGLMGA